MKYKKLNVTITDEIAQVVLNNPDNQNRMDMEMSQELSHVATMIANRDDIKVVVLGAEGNDFSLGLEGIEESEAPSESYSAVKMASRSIEDWARIPFPVIASLKGKCSSLGMSLACAADIRIASESAEFKVPEATWGRVPAGGITQRLPRIIGKGDSMPILLGSEILDAKRAFELGFVNRVTDIGLLEEEVCLEAMKLAGFSTLALQYTKEAINRGSELTFTQALRLELDMYMLLQTSHDRMEGVQAFLEKRPPQFIGE